MFTFIMLFEHRVPINGYIIIELPKANEILLANSNLVKNSCKLIPDNNLNLNCGTVL